MRICRQAYAKINLTLEVLGPPKADGYHKISSVFQTIDLADTLIVQPGSDIHFTCNLSLLQSADNLVIRALEALRKASRHEKGADINLIKRIPIASGLGGGSSDAAAALLALNELWHLELAEQELSEIAAHVGSDVPFFLQGGTALVEGRGEKVTPLPPLPSRWLVLLSPPLDIPDKTKNLYASLSPFDYSEGEHTQRLVEAIKLGKPIDDSYFFNSFERVAYRVFDSLEQYRQRFIEAGAASVHLAGSGPTLFALVEDRLRGDEICRTLMDEEGILAYSTGTIDVRKIIPGKGR